ncbi:hypothetical protein GCM10009096_00530 [Parasphingorhabdus litoris]|uniref:Type II secretion system protein n=1 Tax=Parasphingorhabdus litoris TaxID=394733 RepID=A0ABP3JX83_9SPHN|nr:type II secretion system protein [Parasphingorhabdus litoris]
MKQRCSQEGFTLIEVLVALVVTSFLVTIILDGAVTAKSRQKNQLLQNRALTIAHSQIDSLRDIPGPPSNLKGEQDQLIWTLEETEIARDPREAFVLVEATITAGSEDKPKLVTLQKRYLKTLVVR